MASNDILKSLEVLVQKKLKSLEITNYDIEMSPGSEKGDNYLAVVTLILVNGTDKKGKNITLHWIAKSASQVAEFRKMLRIDLVYTREIYMYCNVFPAFDAFQREKIIGEPFKSYPTIIHSSMEEVYETVIMEDMKAKDYEMMKDRKVPLDYAHTMLVMREYGKFHALSFALRDQQPKVFEKTAEGLCGESIFETGDDNVKDSMVQNINRVVNAFDPVKNVKEYQAACDLKADCYNKFLASMKSGVGGKYSVITHGDSWINNMLFKYEVRR